MGKYSLSVHNEFLLTCFFDYSKRDVVWQGEWTVCKAFLPVKTHEHLETGKNKQGTFEYFTKLNERNELNISID